ncbi:hypothetical protein ACFU7Y_25770 [Kitasatospora sp. NPDC057542]|uniref:hypothetical protein n=1 Tax=Streptomycetaceae TaxID=2062 RepID=UPI001CCBB412|nr:hypothetical protein [Streptomyces sp. LS1784]
MSDAMYGPDPSGRDAENAAGEAGPSVGATGPDTDPQGVIEADHRGDRAGEASPPDQGVDRGPSVEQLAPDADSVAEDRKAPTAVRSAGYENPVPVQTADGAVQVGTYVESARDVLVNPTFPTTTVEKLLEETPIDVEQALLEGVYVEPPNGATATERIQKALNSEYPLAVLVVRPEVGATTFAKRQLALAVGAGREIFLLDGDWQRLTLAQLPRKSQRGQLLELRDSETDQLREILLNELPRYAAELRAKDSFLLVTVTEELWAARKAEVPAGIAVVHLTDPPPAFSLVRSHLTSHHRETLASDLEKRDVAADIKDWSAVRSIRFVRDLLAITDEFDPVAPGRDTEDSAFQSKLVKYDDMLKRLVRGWSKELDQRLAEASAPAKEIDGVGWVSPLTLEERCYSLVLAVRGSVKVAEAIEEGHRLVGLLAGETGGETAAKEKRSDLRGSFVGRGLQTRLKAIGAEADESGVAAFRAAAYGDELLVRVWREYPDVRPRVLEWIMSDSPEQRAEPDGAPIRAVTNVLLATRDAQGLAGLRDLATTPGRRAFAARVLVAAAKDASLGRPARALLYDTAARKSEEGQRLVVQVCRELFDSQRDAAMTRLRRVADNGGPAVWGDVLEAFSAALGAPEQLPWFVDTLRAVHRRAGATPAVRLGVLALLKADVYVLAVVAEPDAAEVIRAAVDSMLNSPEDYPGLFPTLATWLERVPSGKPYEQALATIWAVVVKHGRLADFTLLATVLGGIVREDGQVPEQDIMSLMKADPDLTSVVELKRASE